MRIGDLADATGVSRRLLRYYEEQGLLRPTRLTNGYRHYTEVDVAAVRHIRALLDAGLPTSVIGRILGCVHDDGDRMVPVACPGMTTHLRRERDRIATAIDDLQRSRRALDGMLAMVGDATATCEDAPGPLPPHVRSRGERTHEPHTRGDR